MELVSETLEFINHLMRLSARKHFIELCRRESLKTCIIFRSFTYEYKKHEDSLNI
jgi:hypothetical protein